MGLNFYFKLINKETLEYEMKELQEKYPLTKFTVESDIHICKLSAGWKPLFSSNEHFKSIEEIEEFALYNFCDYEIEDEYGKRYSFEEFKLIISNLQTVDGLQSHIKYVQNDKDITFSYINRSYHTDSEGYEFMGGDWN